MIAIACLSTAHANDLRLSAEFAPATDDGAQLDFRIANDGESDLRDIRLLGGGAFACADETAEGADFTRADGLLEAGDSVDCSLTLRDGAGSGRLIVAARDGDGRWHKVEHGYYADAPATAGRGMAAAAQAVILIGAVHDAADFDLSFTPGETVDFTFTVVNTGEAPLDDIEVTDTLGTAITCPDGPLAPGEALVCTSTYTIQDDDDFLFLENEADLAAESDDGMPVGAQDSIFMIAGFTADARMFKAPLLTGDDNGDGFAGPDDIVTYQFVIKNSSAEDLTLDVLNDPLPGLGAIECPPETLGGNPFTGIPDGELVSGDTVLCSAEYAVTADDRDEGQINNTATAEATSSETFSFVSTGASATVTVPSATVTIEKISLGGTGTFEFTLENAEDSPITITTTVAGDPESSDPIHIDNLNDVDLVISETDPAPDWVLLDAVCSDGTDTWTLEDGSITIPAGTIVPGAEFGCEFVNGTAPEITTHKDLVDEDGDIDGQAEAGELLTYEITLINTGFAPKPGHPVVDDLDDHVIFVSANMGGVYDAATHQASWTVDVPAADDDGPGIVVLTIVVQVVDPIPDGVLAIGNVAYDPDEGPPDCDVIDPPPNCSDPLPTEPNVSDSKDLVAESGAVDGVAEAGEELTYEITLTNTGGSVAENRVQIDQLDPNVIFVSADNGGVYDAGGHQVTWMVDVPAADDGGPGIVVLTITVQVVDPIPAGVTEIGNVTYDPDQGPPDCDVIDPPPNCSDPLPTEPNVRIAKGLVAESGEVDGVAEAGETLTYEITVTNTGGSPWLDYPVIDDLDANVIFVDADMGGDYDAVLHQVMWLVDVPANSVVVLTVVVQVVDPIPPGVTEIGNVAYNPDDGPPDCDVDIPPPNCSPPLPTEPNVRIGKALVDESGEVDGQAEAGETLTYEITVTNTGGSPWPDYPVIDDLDANVIFVDADMGGDYDAVLHQVMWLVDVPADDIVVLTVTVQVTDPIPPGVTEIGNVAYNPDDGPPDCDVDIPPPNCSPPLPTEPNVRIGKALVDESGEVDGQAEAGETLTYEITVANTGGTPWPDYPVVDDLDPNVIFIEADMDGEHDGSATGGQVNWTVDVPAAGENGFGTVVLTVVVQVVDPIPDGVIAIGNVAYNPDDGPPDCDIDIPPPNCAPPLPVEPNVRIAKELVDEDGQIDGQAEAGERLTYQITLTNIGGAVFEDYPVRDLLDANVMFVSADLGGVHSGDATGGQVDWTVDVPAADDDGPGVIVLTVVVQVVDPIPVGVTSIGNVAYNPDIGPPPDCDVDNPPPNCTDIDTEPDVAIAKALVAESGVVDGQAEAGEQLTYEITLTNNGGSVAEDYAVIDQLDPNVIFVSADMGGLHDGAATGGSVLWNVNVPAGASVVLTVVVEVVTPIPAGVTSIGNVAYNPVTGPPECPDPACVEIPADPREPVLVIDKQVVPAQYEPGHSGTYTLAVSVADGVALGAGPVIVVDPMPAPLTITGEVAGSDWDCSGSTQTEAVCVYTGSYPVAPGQMVGGAITIPFTVSEDANGGNVVNIATVTYGTSQSTAEDDAEIVVEGGEMPEPIAVPFMHPLGMALLGLVIMLLGLVAMGRPGGRRDH